MRGIFNILILFCLIILSRCNIAYDESKIEIIKLSDNRFNGTFQNGSDNDNFGYIFNGTNIIEFYISKTYIDTDKWYEKWNYELEINEDKYRTRFIDNKEKFIGEWSNWLEFSFNEANNILILQYDISDVFPNHDLFYLEHNKL